MAQRIHKSNLDLDCEASLATRFSGCQLSCLYSRIAYIDCRLRRESAGACFLKIFGLISKFLIGAYFLVNFLSLFRIVLIQAYQIHFIYRPNK